MAGAARLYFAYGSNLLPSRLCARTPSARIVGPARLHGNRLCWHKHGRDDSGKCDIVDTGNRDDVVHGALYEIDVADWPALDRAEELGTGYQASPVRVRTAHGMVVAHSYRALLIQPGLRPFDWYKRLVVAGARHHRLPPDWIQTLDGVADTPDPDVNRARRHLALFQVNVPGDCSR